MENLRTEYLKEIGESQEATKAKDNAFAKIDDWMSEFYAVAKIALEDKPQPFQRTYLHQTACNFQPTH
ncbi:MAG: hypothetical protein PF517_19755 [Salinivirgaceae bacterium]|jgi:hypothetical protein|nr:hypothetical protein [Salinivirgaceae bacterium]